LAYVGREKRVRGGQVGMDSKKSAGRTAKVEVRAATTRGAERHAPASKRPSTPPPPIAKRREKSVPPPAVPAAANDNDRAKRVASAPLTRGRLPTGSLHTEAREPAEADRLKQRLTALVNAQQKLGELKRAANRNFYEIGELLQRIRDQRLYEVKGYGSFEAYVERETNLGQQFCAQAVRIHETFLADAAHRLGFSRLSAALAALDDEPSGMTAVESLRGGRPAIPPHKL
jgi:hypothetical protein